MELFQPYATLLSGHSNRRGAPALTSMTIDEGTRLLRKIEWCARISHRSEEKMTFDSWRRFIKFVVMEKGDWSVVEHAGATVDAVMDRGITHEWVRHRIASYTQESTRFVNYEKKVDGKPKNPASFVMPEDLDQVDHLMNALGLESAPELGNTDTAVQIWRDQIASAETAYKRLIERGVTPQIARSVLPNALSSRIVTTANLRSWRHFLLMRTTKESHPQMREVTIPLLAQFRAAIPLLFDDIKPMASQAHNVGLAG